MASAEQIAELRRKISEPDEATYTDANLNTQIDDASGDIDSVAVEIWEEKAATYAELVDISEAGSSRKNGQLYKNALDMARYYSASTDSDLVAGVDYPTTTRIVRPVI